MTYSAEYQRRYYQENKERILARNRVWEKANPERVRSYKKKLDPQRSRAVRQAWEARNPEYILWNAARQRAKRDGLRFSIERSDVVIPETCPLLAIPIKRGGGRLNPTSPSLDRINNDLGYVPGNVWVISWHANRIKSNASLGELEMFCSNFLTRFRKRG